jgi:hypothetical protein
MIQLYFNIQNLLVYINFNTLQFTTEMKSVSLRLISQLSVYSERNFNHAYKEALSILRSQTPRDVSVEEKLKKIANERDSYAMYKIQSYRGSLNLRGLTSSEQNHSSVLHFLNPDYDGTNKYCAEPCTLIYDLIRRQQMHSNIFDKLLADGQNNLALERHRMLNNGKENDILTDACFF